jgi:hypothetical protein
MGARAAGLPPLSVVGPCDFDYDGVGVLHSVHYNQLARAGEWLFHLYTPVRTIPSSGSDCLGDHYDLSDCGRASHGDAAASSNAVGESSRGGFNPVAAPTVQRGLRRFT